MSEMSDMGKFVKALKLAKMAGVGMELTYFDVIELLGELDSLKSYISELEKARRWIPVSERLPLLRDSKAVLVFTKSGETYSGMFLGNNEWTGLLHDFKPNEVTHWMPLPPNPEVQE